MSSFPFHPPSIQPLCILLGRGPQPMDHRLVPVRGLLETGLYSGWAVGKQVKLHQLLPITPHCSHYCLNHVPPSPSLWKNCLPRNYSLGAKKLEDHCYKAWLSHFLLPAFPSAFHKALITLRCCPLHMTFMKSRRAGLLVHSVPLSSSPASAAEPCTWCSSNNY